ncbi:membrane protein [Streptococcus pyogenes]|nr:membrane protein [Streptococcus pyogenes]
MTKKPTQLIAYTSILVAFAILIPIIMPLKLIIGPASFTLASHVPLFLAIFMSIPVAILVALGTTLGFFISWTSFNYCFKSTLSFIVCYFGSVVVK